MTEKNEFKLHKKTVKALSNRLNEPEWFLEGRFKALERLDELKPPTIERVDYSNWDLWHIPEIPHQKTKGASWNLVDEAYTQSLINKGLILSDFQQAVSQHEALFQKIYADFAATQTDDFFQAFSAAFLTDSLFLYIPQNFQADKPLEIAFDVNTKDQQWTNRQVLIYAETNAAIEMIERYASSESEEKATANVSVQILAEAGANIQYTSFDQFGKNTAAFIQRTATTKKDAVVNFALAAMNESSVVEDIQVCLEGQGSSSDVKTVAITYGEQVQGINVNVTNKGSHTVGNIFQHGVALDRSTLAFNGIGHILNNAKNSDAQQESRVLILSDEARADANPILLIDEYEVQAGHAASVSRVDPDQLYYLMSRGLAQTDAEKLMIRGFLGIVLSEISVEEVREEFIETINRKLAHYES